MDRQKAIDWLLDNPNPSLRYRTRTELLGEPQSASAVQAARSEIPESPAVQRIFKAMQPDGTWLQKRGKDGQWIGKGVEYGSYATTHYCLAYLAELAMDRSDPRVARAADRYLSLQAPDGDFWNHMSCLLGYNVRTFFTLGYGADPRVRRSLQLLESSLRWDGGYLCAMHEKKRKQAKSCLRGSAKVLLAYSLFPELWGTQSCKALVEYFLGRGGIYRLREPTQPINRDVTSLLFPLTWAAGLLDILLALSTLGYGADPRLDRAWAVLESKRNEQGVYPLDWTPTQALLKAGKRGEANPWVTFYALLALQRRYPGA